MASIIFDIVALLSDDDVPFVTGAQWLIGIGIIGALAAAAFSLIDFTTLARGTRARQTALIH